MNIRLRSIVSMRWTGRFYLAFEGIQLEYNVEYSDHTTERVYV